jgi:hypothetical protein
VTILSDPEEQTRPEVRKVSRVKFQPGFLDRFEAQLRHERRKEDWEALVLVVGCAALFGLAFVFFS